MKPSVGVVIPTRNRPELLLRAIEGVLAQDYSGPILLVVVYDNEPPSPDLDVLPIVVITNSRTPGLAGTRNTGILALDTDLVAFCDDDDVWAPEKLRKQVEALGRRPRAEMVTCAIEVEYADRVVPRLAGTSTVTIDQLARSRMAMLHSSGFLFRRSALVPDRSEDGIGLVAEDAPGSQNEDWDLLLRASRRHDIVHVDEPLVRVLWGRSSFYAYEYATKISSLRWMMRRHPEIKGCAPGAARVYGQLACWSAASGNRSEAWKWTRKTVKANWKEPRAAIALAALVGGVPVDKVLHNLHKRGRGI
ncbi:glycosyltransferase involved in cell wall biosynthesis [Allocatelliglobosispora scoriae]|uniref:Glycosyltransferase involved in cell wall biosynthesis n=1 Tax=Allocatelliglobosispora scoriae TaxID=643052 RepID=A0A841BVV9_9ACTN|nr:glycosyltransferase family 2 protein [Allocatelliglobosispora scoriae]MBB5871598.1 glycosyltransferase involved in cell wall biosynthesis [Allocatelliglobosispora scoriae]